MDTTAITPVTIETPEAATKRKAALASLLAMLAAVAKAVLRLVRRILGISSEAVGEIRDDAVAVAKATRRGIEATGRVVGTGLEGPARVLDATAGAVGATLGAMVPRAPVTAADVARGAVARDDRRDGAVAAAVPVNVVDTVMAPPALTTEHLVKSHALASLDTTGRMAEGLVPLEPRHAVWLFGLDIEARKRLASASTNMIARHLAAPWAGERIPGVPEVPTLVEYASARRKVDYALSLLEAAPGRPALSRAEAFRTIGVGELGEEPEFEVEPFRLAR